MAVKKKEARHHGEQRQHYPKIPTYLVAVCSAFLVALFHLEYAGHFLVGYWHGALEILDCFSIQASF
ncbi:hypothetical protein [Synechococcus sp. MIT S9508]|nr:hypothetical protein [Synechococcus sp. MIT S9508]